MDAQPRFGSTVKGKFASKCLSGLQPHLQLMESPILLVKTEKLRPLLDAIVVTNQRVLGLFVSNLADKGPRIQVGAPDLQGAELRKGFYGLALVVHTLAGEVELGTPKGLDANTLLDAVRDLQEMRGTAPWDVIASLPGAGETFNSALGWPPAPERLPEPPQLEPLVANWKEAEELAAWHMKYLGFDNVKVTSPGIDGGVDVVSAGASAQVKHFSRSPVGAPQIQQLRGAAHATQWSIFYALSGYTAAAQRFAEGAGVALFEYDIYGVVTPVNLPARSLEQTSGHDPAARAQIFALH